MEKPQALVDDVGLKTNSVPCGLLVAYMANVSLSEAVAWGFDLKLTVRITCGLDVAIRQSPFDVLRGCILRRAGGFRQE